MDAAGEISITCEVATNLKERPMEIPPIPSAGVLAMVGISLHMTLLAKLRAKGMLTQDEINEMVDVAILASEEQMPDDSDAKEFRAFLEVLLALLKGQPLSPEPSAGS